jgi:hypothetical protein
MDEIEDQVVSHSVTNWTEDVDAEFHRGRRDCELGDRALLIRRQVSGARHVLSLENAPDGADARG